MQVTEIRNIKFMATPEQSQVIQEALFARGGKWGKSGAVVQKLHQPFLKLRKGALSLVNTTEGGYAKWRSLDHREVTAQEALNAICACSVAIPARKVEVTMTEVYQIVAEAYEVEVADLKFIDG